MENPVIERINFLIKDSALSKSAFATRVGISATAIDNILSGRNNPQLRTVKDISNTFGVNYDWLLSGQGEPYINGKIIVPAKGTKTNVAEDGQLIQALREQIKFLQEDLNVWRETARNLSAHLGKFNGPDSPAFVGVFPIDVSGLRVA